MFDTSQLFEPRIVCAALRAEDGDVLVGIRHYSPDMVKQINSRTDGDKFRNLYSKAQGFVDQHGTYYDRFEAYKIAEKRGQLRRESFSYNFSRKDLEYRLYSENLY